MLPLPGAPGSVARNASVLLHITAVVVPCVTFPLTPKNNSKGKPVPAAQEVSNAAIALVSPKQIA